MTMPSEEAKKARTMLIKCFSEGVNFWKEGGREGESE